MFDNKIEKTIEKDTSDLINWMDKQLDDVKNDKVTVIDRSITTTPTIYRILKNDNSKINNLDKDSQKAYEGVLKASASIACTGGLISAASLVSGITSYTGAMAMGSLGASAMTVGVAEIGAAGIGGLVGMNLLFPLLTPLIAIGAGGIIKHVKKKNKNRELLDTQLKKTYENAKELIVNNQKIVTSNTNTMNELFQENLKIGISLVKKASKEICININDIKNLDQNKRIMQYQEICLKQYRNQHSLEKILFDIIESYNNLKLENDRLIRQINEYEKILNTAMITSNGIINN